MEITMEKYGFVYIWYDKKRKMFYVGSHWGTQDDSYVCSSNRMRKAYRRRPDDFRRKILKIVNTNRQELLDEEHKWLQLIPSKDLGKRYYNLTQHHNGHWAACETKRLTIGEKISKANKGISRNKGKTISEETRKKISNTLKGRPLNYIRTEETRNKISENNKRLQREGKIGTKGMKYSLESRAKMSAWQIGNKMSEESKKKMSESAKGRKWYKDPETGKRVFYRADTFI